MIRKYILFLMFFCVGVPLFSESFKSKFIKGNIAEKTAVVKEVAGDDCFWVCNNAIDFVLETKEIIGSDKEIDGLAVAAVMAYPNDIIKVSSEQQKMLIVKQMNNLFIKFYDSSIVQIAVISKVLLLKNIISTESFSVLLNEYVSTFNVKTIDPNVMKSIINALGVIGNNDSFIILYNFWKNQNYDQFSSELESTLIALSENSVTEILKIIKNDVTDFNSVYRLIEKKSGISKNSLCEIAENVLSESILYIKDSSRINPDIILTQLNALRILNEHKWTKASEIVVTYFDLSKQMYKDDLLTENQFITIIGSLPNISPTESVASLILYLEELNIQKEKKQNLSTEVLISVINALGAIGDKSAFDSLLAVTYLRYPESILTAAKKALSGLRW